MNSSQIIENKVDTPEKLAAAVGKPTKNFLFAAEINELVARIRLLWTLQDFDHTALIPAVKKDLGTLVGQTFIEKINTSAAVAYPSPCFVVYTIDGVEYVQGFVGGAGNYGTGQGQVNASQFVLLYRSDDVLPTISNQYIARGILTDFSGLTFDILENNFPGTLTFVKDYDGEYRILLSTVNTPDISKFQVYIGSPSYEVDNDGQFSFNPISGQQLQITSKRRSTGLSTSDYMTGVPITIRYK